MTTTGWLEIVLFAGIVGLLTRPLGGYLQRVYSGEPTLLRPLLAPIENALYRLAGVKPDGEQDWLQYTISFLIFHALGIIALYGLLRAQSVLPLNPMNLSALAPDLALNTAVSFTTSTSWQSYAGETTLSYFSQMAGITVQSFLSMAVAVVLIRGLALFARRCHRNRRRAEFPAGAGARASDRAPAAVASHVLLRRHRLPSRRLF